MANVTPSLLIASSAPRPVTIDLAKEFPSAELRSESPEIDLTAPGTREVLLHGWSNLKKEKGVPVIWSLGKSSLLRFFVATPRRLKLTLVAQARKGGLVPALVTVRVNRHRVGSKVLWLQHYDGSISIPARLLEAGDNLLELDYSEWPWPISAFITPPPPSVWLVAWREVRFAPMTAANPPQDQEWGSGDAVKLPAGSQVSYYFDLAAGGKLTWKMVGSSMKRPAAPLALEVEAMSAGTQKPILSAEIKPAQSSGELLLPASAHGVTRVTLRVAPRPGAKGKAPAWMRMVDPRFTYRKAAQAPRQPPIAPPPGKAARRPNVLVYIVDTLRADHLGVYGYTRPTSPHLDDFAKSSIVFENNWAQAPWTRPSIASVVTGQYPWVDGVNGRDDAIPAQEELISEALRGVGYRTFGVSTNGNAGPEFGFDQGFDRWVQLNERDTFYVHQPSTRILRLALRWLKNHGYGKGRRQPFFLYLHSTDPHAPYTPRPPFRERFAPDVRSQTLGLLPMMRELTGGKLPDPGRYRHKLVELYDGEVAFDDRSFGGLIDWLKKNGVYRNTLVVFLADHGEEFYDHGGWEHDRTLYQELLHTPLVIHLPGDEGGGRRIAGPVENLDIYPTILEACGVARFPQIEGHSLIELVRSSPGAWQDRPTYAFQHNDGRSMRAVRWRRWKLIEVLRHGRPFPVIQLFDLAIDPGERHDLSLEHPVLKGFLEQMLRREIGRPKLTSGTEGHADPKLERRLKALGYVG